MTSTNLIFLFLLENTIQSTYIFISRSFMSLSITNIYLLKSCYVIIKEIEKILSINQPTVTKSTVAKCASVLDNVYPRVLQYCKNIATSSLMPERRARWISMVMAHLFNTRCKRDNSKLPRLYFKNIVILVICSRIFLTYVVFR